MLKTYATPGLRVHGSISVLTQDPVEGDGAHEREACFDSGLLKEFPEGSKPFQPEFDVWCGFSHS